MKNNMSLYQFRFLIILLVIAPISFGFLGDDKSGTKQNKPIYKLSSTTDEGGKKGDAYRLNINNINLPLNRKGVIAAVNIPNDDPNIDGAGGKFGNHVFLFSGGFFLSGYANGTLFTNAVASASLVEDYTPGLAGTSGDPRAQLYVIKSADPAFGTAWQDWKDAVDLGADFYDGNGDGVYNPVDNNGNGEWDPDEDKPDIIGDETVWTVYWDGVAAPQRRYNNVSPLGIEVRQTVFAYASAGAIGNLIFVRYRFKYVGLGDPNEPNTLDNVLFGVWADVDLGDAADDLVGSDIGRNAGYTYNSKTDAEYGTQTPCYMIDFFSGPIDYIPGVTYTDVNLNGVYDDGIDAPLDTAFSFKGQLIGLETFPGATNLPIASFIQYINNDPSLNDPSNREEARNYMEGKTRDGENVDPCTFPYGNVKDGTNCIDVDPRYWYSGDPVANNGNGSGWINIVAADSRQMTNTGPFTLRKNEEKEIVVAYVVGQGENPKNSITVARAIDDGAQTIFNLNFLAPSAPPPPVVTVESNEDFIDLTWPTKEQFKYSSKSSTWDVKFGGYNVYAFQTFSSSEKINNQPNISLIGRYQVNDYINNLYAKNGATGGIEILYPASPKENRLDSNIYKNPETGILRFRLTEDPFTGGKLIKGKPYYLLVTAYGVNFDALFTKSGIDSVYFTDYYLTDQTFVQAVENPKSQNAIKTVLMGKDIYSPPVPVEEITGKVGPSDGRMQIDIVDKASLTGDKYKVSFFPDKSTEKFSSFWKLENTTTNTVLIDSAKDYNYGDKDINFRSAEGFIVKLEKQIPRIAKIDYNTSTVWYTDTTKTNYYYLAKDIDQSKLLGAMTGDLKNKSTNIVSAVDLRNVELRFGEQGKAYRYLVGFVGTNPPARRNSYVYAEGVTSANPSVPANLLTQIGKLGEGFVDVPFTAWIKDDPYGESRQLAVGFLERTSLDGSTVTGGKPDGLWDSGTSIDSTAEFIFIFNSSYDPNGNQQELKGNFPAATTVWADLKGYTIPNDASATQEQRNIALSPFFNTLYAVSVQKRNANSNFVTGDKFIFSVENYPYAFQDAFEFTTKKNGALTEEQEKSLFDKVNVFPNPLYGYNPYTGYNNLAADDPFVTFTNLPNEEVSIKIYSLSGQLLRTLVKDPNSTSPFLNWNLQNESGLRVASGLYLAIVSSPKFGDKVLKFSIIMPQKQLPRF
ncbi:MAG: hypothetical protein IPH97_05695 [Ignavibacteriales bacterium]|nr:hypothetical protein [Ignavibacteriales bacterium]